MTSTSSAEVQDADHHHNQRLSLTDLKPFFFGGIASCVAEAVTFPIDTAKTRLQLQGNNTFQ